MLEPPGLLFLINIWRDNEEIDPGVSFQLCDKIPGELVRVFLVSSTQSEGSTWHHGPSQLRSVTMIMTGW